MIQYEFEMKQKPRGKRRVKHNYTHHTWCTVAVYTDQNTSSKFVLHHRLHRNSSKAKQNKMCKFATLRRLNMSTLMMCCKLLRWLITICRCHEHRIDSLSVCVNALCAGWTEVWYKPSNACVHCSLSNIGDTHSSNGVIAIKWEMLWEQETKQNTNKLKQQQTQPLIWV